MISILDLPRGIHVGIPDAVYHERILGVVNKGALDQMAKTPAHYRAWLVEPPQEDTPTFALGKALHCRVLEPERFASTYIAETKHEFRRPSSAQRNAKNPSDETLKAIAYFDAWERETAGKIELWADDAAKVEAMRESIMRHPIASKLVVGGVMEATVLWDEPASGLLCKARLDYWQPEQSAITDLKTTEDASPAAFARSVASYRYDVQQAHYEEGVRLLGYPNSVFRFIAIEKSPPFAVAVYQLDELSIQRGIALRRRNLAALNRCLVNDEWPAYPEEIASLTLPQWAFKESA